MQHHNSKPYNLYQKDTKAAPTPTTTAAVKPATPATTSAAKPATPAVPTPTAKTTPTPAPAPAKVSN